MTSVAQESQCDVSVLSEPLLEFRYGQAMADPHAGLTLFGPYDTDSVGHPRGINYVLIGTPQGLAAFESFGQRLQTPIVPSWYGDEVSRAANPYLWPPFPGFEAAFACQWEEKPAWKFAISSERLESALKQRDSHKRVYDVTNAYLEAIAISQERDESHSVILCIVPDEVWQACRPTSSIAANAGVGRPLTKREQAQRRTQPDFFETYTAEQYELSPDFRRQLKARAMDYKVPLQLIRESTLKLDPEIKFGERSLTELSDRAWNLSTAIYYKAGGKPWRLSTARDGVCYVGLAFRRSPFEETPTKRTACCAAQMFLDTGDGVVFRGEFGPWYSPERNEYHLSGNEAEHLLQGVLQAYEEQGGKKLNEVFLHARSTISREEFEGYARACPDGVKLVAIRVRPEAGGIQFYRKGDWVVQRGTLWVVDDRTAYLWGTGFKPSLLTYDGWELPIPLRIDIQHGAADIRQVASDILGLTKLNYNACRLADASPVTVAFSDKVGEILVSNPSVRNARPNFKFYI